MAEDTLSGLNPYALFRFVFGYPDERHLEFFGFRSLEELRSLYLELFEAGLPHPRCPLLESFYVPNRPATEVVLENKLFYKHFGLQLESKAAPDHLLTQLDFLSWIEYCRAAGNPDTSSLEAAKRDFLVRHVSHWVPRATSLARQAGAGCYVDLLDAFLDTLYLEVNHAIHACL